jgi:prepilin-type N-terminal cleavage/methylation domain-containing protein
MIPLRASRFHLRASRYGGQAGRQVAQVRGFSLVELLIAMTICAVISAGIAAVVPPARAAFERTPAELDLQQRGRTAIDAIVQAIRAAGTDVVVSEALGPLAGVVPAVIPFEPDASATWFARLKVIAPRSPAAQGTLAQDQQGPNGDLVMSPTRCPLVQVVCGFTRDATAVVADGSGRFDIFTIAMAQEATERLTPARRFMPPYAAGSIVVEVEAHTFQLESQPDGSRTLVRVTAAGAVQPIVDRVTRLQFEPYAIDAGGEPTPIPVDELTDGPWWSGGPDGDYDDDVFRVKRVDVVLSLRAALPLTVERTFRFAVFLRNVP